jgi:hypothetical protein
MKNGRFSGWAALCVAAVTGGPAVAADGGLSFSGVYEGVPFRESVSYTNFDTVHGTRAYGLLLGIFGYPYPAIQGNVLPQGFATSYSEIDVRSFLHYTFSVEGAAGATPVPVDLVGRFGLDSNFVLDTGASAGYRVSGLSSNGSPDLKSGSFACSVSQTAGCGAHTFADSVFALPNAVYDVYLSLNLQARSEGVPAAGVPIGRAGGDIASYLFIDPAWAVANPGYSLVVNGVGNAALPIPPAVPEPRSALLLAAGLGLLAAVGFRRQRASATKSARS